MAVKFHFEQQNLITAFHIFSCQLLHIYDINCLFHTITKITTPSVICLLTYDSTRAVNFIRAIPLLLGKFEPLMM